MRNYGKQEKLGLKSAVYNLEGYDGACTDGIYYLVQEIAFIFLI